MRVIGRLEAGRHVIEAVCASQESISMAQVWVIKPGEEERLPGLEAEAERLQGELAYLQSLSTESACRLCGNETELTEEHAPSKKAGNTGPMIRGVIDYPASLAGGSVLWKTERIQGAKYDSLCARCNNNTGSWYNSAYVQLVRAAKTVATPQNAGKVCPIPIVHPQRVAKQALTSIVATSQPGLTARYPALRALLLDKEDRRPITPLQLWLYLRVNPGGVATGLATGIDLERRQGHLLAGFSFWPLGWIITISSVDVRGALDVSAWTELGYRERGPVTANLPCQWAISPYPADFRGPEEFPDAAWQIPG
jgi:hypothetical protein